MFGSPFYHSTIKSYVAAFGALFNDIYIVREQTDGTEVQRIKVPIAYGSKELWMARLKQDPNLTRNVGLKLPRLSFDMMGLNYDSTRKLNSNISRLRSLMNTQGHAARQFMGVPYTLNFNLNMYARNREDLLQIVEQILPFFTPDYTVTVKTLPSIGISDDVPILLTSTNTDDTYEGPLGTARMLTWTFQFQMMGMLYGPSKEKKVIREVQIDSFVLPTGQDMTTPVRLTTEDDGGILTEDGESALVLERDADGTETATRVSRVTITPNPASAQAGDDFGFTTDIEHFTDGQRRNDLTREDEDL